MLSLEDFEKFEIMNRSHLIVGGWSESVETATGTVTHYISEDVDNPEEYWVLSNGNTDTRAESGSDLGRNGDVG